MGEEEAGRKAESGNVVEILCQNIGPGVKPFFFFSVLALLRREMSHYNHTFSLIGFCEAVFRCIQRLQKYIHAEYRRMENCIKMAIIIKKNLHTIVNFAEYLNPTIQSSSNKDILKTNFSNNSK